MSFISENWGWISSLIGVGGGGAIGFFTGRKREKSKDKETEAGALESTQNVYDTLTRHMEKSLNEMKEEIKDVKTENFEQRREMRKLQEDNRKLHIEISNLMRENNELKEMVRKLSTENEKLYSELRRYKKK